MHACILSPWCSCNLPFCSRPLLPAALLTLGPELMHFEELVQCVHVGLLHAMSIAVVSPLSFARQTK